MRIIILVLGFLCSSATHALAVLQYHHISDDTPKATSLSPKLFKQHLDYLDQHKFTVWSMEQLVEALKNKSELPDKTVVITFDDGYKSIYTAAWPLLKKKNYPFSVFVNTQHHDEQNSQYMSWQQLKELAEAGVVIGNHSVSHGHMVRLQNDENEKQWLKRNKDEIAQAQKRIDQELGKQLKVFAHPFGEYNSELLELLDQKHYLAFGQQSGPISPSDNHQILPRFPFGGHYGDMEDFAIKVNSVAFPKFKESFYTEQSEMQQQAGGNGESFKPPILPAGVDRPMLILELEDKNLAAKTQCFASVQGAAQVEVQNSKVVVQAKKDLKPGRSRYNCTAAKAEGVFYWYSTTFLKRNDDGSWYRE